MQRATGTRTVGDLLLHPVQLIRQVGAALGRTPAGALVDQASAELAQPLAISGFVRNGSTWRQGLLCFDASMQPSLYWRPYRPLRPYGAAVPFPLPAHIVEGGRVTGPGSWKIKKPLFTLLVISGPEASFEVAVPRVDVPAFTRQVEVASAIWVAREHPDLR